MTNAEMSLKLGVTESYASYLRNGKRMPSAQVMSRMVEAFGLDGNEIFRAYKAGPDAMAAYLKSCLPRVG